MTASTFKSMRQTGLAALVIATGLGLATSASAKGFQVGVVDCPAVKGQLAVDTSNASAWDQLKANNPSGFVKSMVAESSCFTMVEGGSAQYTLRFGPLTAQEFQRGPSGFSGRSVLEPVTNSGGGIPQAGGNSGGGGFSLADADKVLGDAERLERMNDNKGYYADRLTDINDVGDARSALRLADSLSGSVGGLLGGGNKAPKDRYAYVEVLNTSGQVVARGFGHNARHDLDFSTWQANAMAVDTFAKKKNSRRAGGALYNAYNAYNDAQKQIMAPSFGSPIR